MNAALLGGLVEQWVWRCELVATEYQLRPSTDLRREVEMLVEQAVEQARLLQATGSMFLAKVEGRLALTAHIASLSELLLTEQAAEPALNAAGRVEALCSLTHAFGLAADRLEAMAA
jgi:hypothetical protein